MEEDGGVKGGGEHAGEVSDGEDGDGGIGKGDKNMSVMMFGDGGAGGERDDAGGGERDNIEDRRVKGSDVVTDDVEVTRTGRVSARRSSSGGGTRCRRRGQK